MTRPTLALLLGSFLLACAQSSGTDAAASDDATVSSTDPVDIPAGPTLDWADPYHGAGVVLKSLDQAQRETWFKLLAPSFGPPDLIQMTPEGTAKELMAIVLVYHLPAEGTVFVEQMPTTDTGSEALGAIVSAHEGEFTEPAEGATRVPTYSLVEMRGTVALLVQGQGLGRVIWIEDGTRVDILGKTLTPTQAIELARSF
jgi:hypothetical protein